MLSQRIRRKFEKYPDELMFNTAKRLQAYHWTIFPKKIFIEIENTEDAILFINWYLKYADGLILNSIRAETVEELIIKLDILGI